jgi:hypothetical protein
MGGILALARQREGLDLFPIAVAQSVHLLYILYSQIANTEYICSSNRRTFW